MKIKSTFASFSTNDVAAAKEFYAGTLGLAVTEVPEGLELALPDTRIFIYPKSNHQAAGFTVLNFEVDDIDPAVNGLIAKNVAFEHYDDEYMKTDEKGVCRNDGAHPGPKAIAWFKDPAGNFLALIQEK